MNNPLVRKQRLPIEDERWNLSLPARSQIQLSLPRWSNSFWRKMSFLLTGRPSRSHSKPGRTSWLAGVLAHHRWGVAAASLLLAMIVALTIVTPQAVWAGLQRLTGYVPGIGFVDSEKTRVLTGPIEATRDGVTLHVRAGGG